MLVLTVVALNFIVQCYNDKDIHSLIHSFNYSWPVCASVSACVCFFVYSYVRVPSSKF